MNSQGDLPVSLLTWLAAFLPVLLLLLLLVWRRWATSSAAPVALAAAVAVALLLFRTPLLALAVAAGKGIWDAVFVLYVIWPALILYNVANEAGAFGAMQSGLRRLMPDRLLVVLAFSWVLAPFIQSMAGFGTPLAVTTPLLIGLGVKPLYAVLLPMIGAAWANMFGSLGTTWLATRNVVDIPDIPLMVRTTTLLLLVPILTSGLTIAWFYGRGWALRRGGPAVLAVSVVQGGLQLLLVPLAPTIGTFLATAAGMGVLFALNRWGFYRQEDEDEPQRIFTEAGIKAFHEQNEEEREKARRPGSGFRARPAGRGPGEARHVPAPGLRPLRGAGRAGRRGAAGPPREPPPRAGPGRAALPRRDHRLRGGPGGDRRLRRLRPAHPPGHAPAPLRDSPATCSTAAAGCTGRRTPRPPCSPGRPGTPCRPPAPSRRCC